MRTVGPIFGVWRPVEPKLHRRIHDRLDRTGGCETVRYEPSRLDRNEVVAEIDPTVFLGRTYSSPTARLRVEFDCSGEPYQYWMQWWEPGPGRGFGWHGDETEPEYGPVHLQIEYADGRTDRRATECDDHEHPYRRFERHLTSIDAVITELGWK